MKKTRVYQITAAIAAAAILTGSIATYNIYESSASTQAAVVSETEDSTLSLEDVDVISFLGDSITYGLGSDVRFSDIVAELAGIETSNNYGISGTLVSTGSTYKIENAFINRYSEIDEDSDIIFIMGGTNDWARCVTLGSLGDTTTDTYYGALEALITALQEEYPDAEIVLATPIKRVDAVNYDGYTQDEDGNMVNPNGDSLEDFANAVLEVAEAYGITVLDLYHAEETDFTSDTSYTTYWSDGLHPNSNGQTIMAEYIYEQLAEIYA